MSDTPSIIPVMQSEFLAKVVERACLLGAERGEVLTGSLLRAEILAGPSTPIPSASVYLASSRAAELSANRHICAELAEEYDWRTGFVLPPSTSEHPSVADTLLAWLQFVEGVQVSMRYRLSVEGSLARLSGRRFHKASQPPGQADAWDVASWIQMFRELLGSTWVSSSVMAAVFDPEAIPCRLVSSENVRKSDAWGLDVTFPSAWLMERSLRPPKGKPLSITSSEEAVELASLFETLDYASWPGTEGFAKFLGFHPKALQRLLAAENTSCSALADTARSRLAVKWIFEGRMPLRDIAKGLGYRNASAFTRACRRWFGCPPEQLRSGDRDQRPYRCE